NAMQWLAERSGFGVEGRNLRSYAFQNRIATIPASTACDAAETPPDHAFYAAFLAHAQLAASGQNYLQQRGLNDATITRFGIGQMPSFDVLRSLIRLFGFARIEAAGLLTQKSTPDRFWSIFPQDSLLFPYFEAGEIAYFQARVISDQAD